MTIFELLRLIEKAPANSLTIGPIYGISEELGVSNDLLSKPTLIILLILGEIRDTCITQILSETLGTSE